MIKNDYEEAKEKLVRAKEVLANAKTEEDLVDATWRLANRKKAYIDTFKDYNGYLNYIALIENSKYLDLKVVFNPDIYEHLSNKLTDHDVRYYAEHLTEVFLDFMMTNQELMESNAYKLDLGIIKAKSAEELDFILDEFKGLVK